MNTTSPRASMLPAIIGFALAGLLILGLGFWVARREPVLPQLELIQPASDTVIAGPVRLRFRSSLSLRLQPTGWGSGRYHPHVMIDSVEVMAGAASIRRIGDLDYEWTLPPMDQPAVIQLIWSLPNHQRLPEGKSKPVRISPPPKAP